MYIYIPISVSPVAGPFERAQLSAEHAVDAPVELRQAELLAPRAKDGLERGEPRVVDRGEQVVPHLPIEVQREVAPRGGDVHIGGVARLLRHEVAVDRLGVRGRVAEVRQVAEVVARKREREEERDAAHPHALHEQVREDAQHEGEGGQPKVPREAPVAQRQPAEAVPERALRGHRQLADRVHEVLAARAEQPRAVGAQPVQEGAHRDGVVVVQRVDVHVVRVHVLEEPLEGREAVPVEQHAGGLEAVDR
eukprot:scaffold322190_cov27-Tisochrysis_lutea.AAC.1